MKIGDIYQFPGQPGYWRIVEGDDDQGIAQRIPDSEAKKELSEKALLKRLGELCNV